MLRVDIERRIEDFHLRPQFESGNDLVVLFGPSGCGKSMTLRTIAGLTRPDRGVIRIGDTVVFNSDEHIDIEPQHRGVGYVVQDLALFPHMSAYDNIAFSLNRWKRDGRHARVMSLLETLDLLGLEDRRPGQLSGGQQQRVALARALAAEPRLLLLDEPFTGLDQELRTVLRREVVQLRRRLGLTAVFVTHDLPEVYALAERVVVMDGGVVLQQGTLGDVMRRPASKRVAELTEVRNIIPGEVVAFAEGVSVVQTPWFTARVAGSMASGPGARVHSAGACVAPTRGSRCPDRWRRGRDRRGGGRHSAREHAPTGHAGRGEGRRGRRAAAAPCGRAGASVRGVRREHTTRVARRSGRSPHDAGRRRLGVVLEYDLVCDCLLTTFDLGFEIGEALHKDHLHTVTSQSKRGSLKGDPLPAIGVEAGSNLT